MQTRSQSRKINENSSCYQEQKNYILRRSQRRVHCDLPYENQMITRSRKNLAEKEVNIDFDEASKYWKNNKMKLGNGCYMYL